MAAISLPLCTAMWFSCTLQQHSRTSETWRDTMERYLITFFLTRRNKFLLPLLDRRSGDSTQQIIFWWRSSSAILAVPLIGLALPRYTIGLKNPRHFVIQSEVESGPLVTPCTRFPALCFSYMYCSKFWLVLWIARLVVIGYNDYFDFWFFNTHLKTALSLMKCYKRNLTEYWKGYS